MTRLPAHHLDGRPVVYRASYRGSHAWRGYIGSDVLGVSYGLCQPESMRHSHKTQAAAALKQWGGSLRQEDLR